VVQAGWVMPKRVVLSHVEMCRVGSGRIGFNRNVVLSRNVIYFILLIIFSMSNMITRM
jgi:hypothetical protein